MELKMHSFEAGRRGKPDEFETQLANLVAAELIQRRRNMRCDLRVNGEYDPQLNQRVVHVGGELSRYLWDQRKGIKQKFRRIFLRHYNTVHRTHLGLDQFHINFTARPQSDTLAMNSHAGDSGNPIAVAYRDTPNTLPWERYLSVELRDLVDNIFQNDGFVPAYLQDAAGVERITGLGADGKVGVSALYNGVDLDRIVTITVAAQQEEGTSIERIRPQLEKVIGAYMQRLHMEHHLDFGIPRLTINGLGDWYKGGWEADAGSREAKPPRDGFATYGCNEDSFSGEDPSKPSATGTMLARYVAVQVVKNNLARYAHVSLGYEIGREDVDLLVFTNGTGIIDQTRLHHWVRRYVDLTIPGAAKKFGLRNADLFTRIARNSDYFHDPRYQWNQQELVYATGVASVVENRAPAK